MDTTALALTAGKLRKLALRLEKPHTKENNEEVRELLTTENIERLAERDCLRSLRMYQGWETVPTLDYLRKFVGLSHVSTQVTGDNYLSLVSATVHLPQLRALELEESYTLKPVAWRKLLSQLATNRPELRHLALRALYDERKLMGAIGRGSALLCMEKLASLEIGSWIDPSPGNWELLEELAERGRLEHLVTEPAPDHQGPAMSVGLMCRVIVNCRVSYSLLVSFRLGRLK